MGGGDTGAIRGNTFFYTEGRKGAAAGGCDASRPIEAFASEKTFSYFDNPFGPIGI